jgi:predicted PurR-regulated permease PerM
MSSDLAPQGQPDQPAQWAKATRYVAAAFLVVAVVLLLLFLLPIINTVALGFIIAFLMYLPIRAMVGRTSLQYRLVVILVYVLLLIIWALVVFRLVQHLADGAGQLAAALNQAVTELENDANILRRAGVTAGGWLSTSLLSLISGAVELIGTQIVAMFFSFLLLLAMGTARGTLASWIPPRYRRESTLLLMKLDQVWVGYLVAQVIYGTALAVFSFAEYALLGVPYPLVMAVLTGFISLVPTVGGLLASLIVAIPCLFLGSTVLTDMSNGAFALLVLGINVVITQLTYNFFALPIVGRFVRLPTALVLVGVLVGIALGSIVFAFLAVPILSTLVTTGSYVLSKIAQRDPFPGEDVPEPPEEGFFSQLLISSPTQPNQGE